ncbi:28S ribosomal protein S35, mitochondrial [Crotalus tigris]|uniref:28S ribosomal protein S35, mitochondrial n=1 Tax=Crotalus tigris TaxID=88082 RepID=UPI00192F5888|nr:28S ribosomal protein S35, mitochondrial [Crotalus tigris]
MALAWRRCPALWRRQASPAGYATLGGGSAQPQRRGGPKESPAERRAQKELIYGNSQRSEKMDPDQDWTSVYPTAASFKPSAVPLPIRMGYPVRGGVAPAKEGNLELLKIPNFLHLTPVAIKKHCAALKDFCTEWPSALDSDEKCLQHFPIEISTTDYVSAGPSLRNPKARVVTLKVKLSSLNLDDHARKKFIKLVGERYCRDTDSVTITTDRCPFRKQNYDYAMYLLTVLFHESWKIEPWEKEITEADMLEYVWENSASEKNALRTLLQIRAAEKSEEISREELLASEVMQDYKKSMVLLKNEGETEKNLLEYKNSVKRLLNIQGL